MAVKTMKVHAGTSGYSYKEWRGSFYPEDIASGDMLAAYAKQLDAVEINNTFYRMPRSHVMEEWAQTVPKRFRFSIKASRRITHQQRLKDSEESVEYLAKRVALLEDKLATVLFQLPPFLRCDPERLQHFLSVWPKELPAAFEFRHDSWFTEEVFDLLREAGAALVNSEDGKLKLPKTIATTDWCYLRLRKERYTAQGLNGWLKRARNAQVKTCYAFFKHEDAGAGPKLAQKFVELAGPAKPARAPRKQQATKRSGKQSA